jgi:hypothetical protein
MTRRLCASRSTARSCIEDDLPQLFTGIPYTPNPINWLQSDSNVPLPSYWGSLKDGLFSILNVQGERK